MSRIGHGYGSEWHLLRWMGRHRQDFDRRVLGAVGQPMGCIEWLDCGMDPTREWPDLEPKGLDFLPVGDLVRAAWEAAWPQTGNVPNWDAVGHIQNTSGGAEWLLVEAKAHTGELASSCGAKNPFSLSMIQGFFDQAMVHLGVSGTPNWLTGHYQYANRVATLSFLARQGLAAHLLFVYFTGERHHGWNCPVNQNEWDAALAPLKSHLGLPAAHPLSGRVHDLFLPVV